MVPDGRTVGRTEWTDGRTDDAKTISLRLRRGIISSETCASHRLSEVKMLKCHNSAIYEPIENINIYN